MNELVTRQGAIQYEVTGGGPTVLFLHSALADHRQWCVQVDALSHDYRCITYDLLGYGSSDNASDNYDPADTLLALLDHLEVGTVTLVGSSLGGSVSIHAATRYPDRIRSIVLAGDFAPFFCTLAISFELMLILASFFSPVGWD